jgi:hypothetical protein
MFKVSGHSSYVTIYTALLYDVCSHDILLKSIEILLKVIKIQNSSSHLTADSVFP